jgi:hypothetical protein
MSRGAAIAPRKLHRQRRGEKFITHVQSLDTDYLRGGARLEVDGRWHIAPPPAHGGPYTDCAGGAFITAAVMGLPVVEEVAKTGEGIWTGSLSKVGGEGWSDLFTLCLKYPFEEVPDEGHVIMRLRRNPRWYEDHSVPRFRWAEVGGSDNPSSGGGMSWFEPTPERIAEFTHVRHFPGY